MNEVLLNKLKFEYVVEPSKETPSKTMKIQTPWIDIEDTGNWKDEFQNVVIQSDGLSVTEQLFDNGFHVLFIQTAERIIIRSNWELDYISDENAYLPRIQ